MICQSCGVEAPTKYVEFYQNIGALVMRFHKSIQGNLCKNCINKYFWEFTLINFALGWWGMISFFVTPFFILNNIIRYLCCLGLPAVPEGATPPQLTEKVIELLRPHVREIFQRLGDGEKLEHVAEDIAPHAGVTPGQVMLFAYEIARASQEDEDRRWLIR